jgi:hypothetical protein
MNPMNLPKMVYSYGDGWLDLIRIHPSVARMFAFYVAPMSLIPPAMFVYAHLASPGRVFPAVVPDLTANELILGMGAFYLVELAMVFLMASLIQQIGDVVDIQPPYHDAFMLAAVAPTPLWLSTLALFVPSMVFNGAVLILAWMASAALIYHGVEPLFRLEGHSKSRLMGSMILMAGVLAWCALLAVLALAMSMVVGLR